MATQAGRTQDELRRHNLSTILREIHQHGPRTRADLASATGLNRSTVGVLTTELAGAGLVREQAPVARGGVGRPSIVVGPAEDVFVVAVDVGVDHLSVARVGLGGQVYARREIVQARTNPSVNTVIRRIARLVEHVLADAQPAARCVGLGVAVCGVVQRDQGVVRLSPNLGWQDVPFGALLAERLDLGVPCALGNDADLGVLAEVTRGVARGHADVIYLSGEVGLGGGVIVDGRPLVGTGGYAGEIGHLVVNPGGAECRCGSQGCWETVVGEDAILSGFPESLGRGRQAAMAVIERAAAGDPSARERVALVGRWLGMGIGNLVNVFNPEIVVLGGLLHELFPVVEADVLAEMNEVTMTAPGECVRVCVTHLGSDSPLLGAAELAFAGLLADPLGSLALTPARR